MDHYIPGDLADLPGLPRARPHRRGPVKIPAGKRLLARFAWPEGNERRVGAAGGRDCDECYLPSRSRSPRKLSNSGVS
jgi:hypothetical protein